MLSRQEIFERVVTTTLSQDNKYLLLENNWNTCYRFGEAVTPIGIWLPISAYIKSDHSDGPRRVSSFLNIRGCLMEANPEIAMNVNFILEMDIVYSNHSIADNQTLGERWLSITKYRQLNSFPFLENYLLL